MRAANPPSSSSAHMPNDVSRDGGNRGGLACDLDLGYGLSSEEIQQEFAGRSDEPSRRLASPGSHSLACPGPLELESHAAEAPSKKPRCASDVAPQGCIEIRHVAPRPPAVRPAHVLVMHEELVEVGKSPDPTDAEEARRRPRPDLIDERREVALGQLRRYASRPTDATAREERGQVQRGSRAHAARGGQRGREWTTVRAGSARRDRVRRRDRTAVDARVRRTGPPPRRRTLTTCRPPDPARRDPGKATGRVRVASPPPQDLSGRLSSASGSGSGGAWR